MTTQSSEIWVDNVEDYIFCPRKLYLTITLRAKHPEPTRVKRGKRKHETRENWIARQGGEQSVTIKNEELGLIGKIDGIIEHQDHINVYEIKDTDRDYYYDSEIIQGVVYAELARRNRNKPARLIFRSQGTDHEIEITDDLREKALEAVEGARHVVEGAVVPEVQESEKCIRCPLRNACG